METGFARPEGAASKRCFRTAHSTVELSVPPYTSLFDLLVRGNETGDWRRGWDSCQADARAARGLKTTRTAMSERERVIGGPSGTSFATGCDPDELSETTSLVVTDRSWRDHLGNRAGPFMIDRRQRARFGAVKPSFLSL